jgi:hypothetical protein
MGMPGAIGLILIMALLFAISLVVNFVDYKIHKEDRIDLGELRDEQKLRELLLMEGLHGEHHK